MNAGFAAIDRELVALRGLQRAESGPASQDRTSAAWFGHTESEEAAIARQLRAMDATTAGDLLTDDKLAELIAWGASAEQIGRRVIELAREYAQRCVA